MAKRFADTALSRKAWFRRLPPSLKCAWRFLCDECDVAGVWSIDMDAMSFFVGEDIDLETMIAAFNEDEVRVRRIDRDKLFLSGFIEFQYGKLSEECKPHRPVITRLAKLNLLKGYQKGFKTLEDKDKDKEKEKDKEKDNEFFDFDALYRKYPRKEGKAAGFKQCRKQIQTRADYDALSRAIDRYAAHCAKTNQLVKHFGSFLGSDITTHPWRDWLDPETGTVAVAPIAEPDWVREEREREKRNAV